MDILRRNGERRFIQRSADLRRCLGLYCLEPDLQHFRVGRRGRRVDLKHPPLRLRAQQLRRIDARDRIAICIEKSRTQTHRRVA